MLQTVITVLCSVIASSGFWLYLQGRVDKKDASKQMLLGLAHDRIMYIGIKYIERGFVTKDEFENLSEYLYAPYKKLGGNGSADRIMDGVKKLPIRAFYYEIKEGGKKNEAANS